ncbi:MAG: transposase [Bacteroides sp.]|nr:transposase [Bacteroides sp.]
MVRTKGKSKSKSPGKGRDKELMNLRDEKLLRRYYELTEVESMRFDRALRYLSWEEFFISEARIMSIVRRSYNKQEGGYITPPSRIRKPPLTDEPRALLQELV